MTTVISRRPRHRNGFQVIFAHFSWDMKNNHTINFSESLCVIIIIIIITDNSNLQ